MERIAHCAKHPLYVNGIGILSPGASSAAELMALADRLKSGEALSGEADFTAKVSFPAGVPPAKVRRAPRYVKMTLAAASLAWEDGGLPDEEREAVGTVFLTGYGSLESTIAFTESVLDGVPSLASPTRFSYTVPNSCLGQTCIAHGFRGASTMLLGGDPVEYAALLLAGGKAKHIVCGAVDEWNEDLRTSLRAAGQIPAETAVDGAVMLLLSGEEGRHAYCRVTNFSSAGIPACPYVEPLDIAERGETSRNMAEALAELSLDASPELLLTTANGSDFDAVEERALSEVFGGDVPRLAAKRVFGEAFAAGYLENIALGAALLRLEKEKENTGIRSLVATGMDLHGNYLAAKLEV